MNKPREFPVNPAARPIGPGRTDVEPNGDADALRPVLSVRQLDTSRFRFSLRSKLNARLMSGGPLPWHGDLRAHALALAEFCKMEECLQVAPHARGFVVRLVAADGTMLGRSATLATEALAIANRRLIMVQAQAARVVLVKS